MLQIQGDFVFWYGQIFNRRHVAELISAFEKIAPQFPQTQLLVVGENRTQKPFIPIDEMVKEINRKLRRKAIIRKIFVQDTDDIVALCSGAKAGAYLSDYEGFGLPPLEFLACGTPVLAPNTTGLANTLQGRQVVINDPTDINEIAQKLTSTLGNRELQEKIRIEGPKYATQFSWEKCAQQTLDVLIQAEKEKP